MVETADQMWESLITQHAPGAAEGSECYSVSVSFLAVSSVSEPYIPSVLALRYPALQAERFGAAAREIW